MPVKTDFLQSMHVVQDRTTSRIAEQEHLPGLPVLWHEVIQVEWLFARSKERNTVTGPHKSSVKRAKIRTEDCANSKRSLMHCDFSLLVMLKVFDPKCMYSMSHSTNLGMKHEKNYYILPIFTYLSIVLVLGCLGSSRLYRLPEKALADLLTWCFKKGG